MATARQTCKSLPGASQPTGVKTTTNRIYAWQFKFGGNSMPTVQCMSNGLICGYTAGIYFYL